MHVYPSRYNVRSLGQLQGLGQVDPKAVGMVIIAGGLLGAWMLWATLADRPSMFSGLGKTSPPTKGWAKQAPKKMSTRKKMPRSCFLDQKNRKYPVCAKSVRGRQRVSCKGTLAAYQRARQQKKQKLAKKAIRIAKRNGCSWAQAH